MSDPVTDYWSKHYVRNGLCSICGNKGVFDTRGMKSAAGVSCGDGHYCICPNGQAWRAASAAPFDVDPDLRAALAKKEPSNG